MKLYFKMNYQKSMISFLLSFQNFSFPKDISSSLVTKKKKKKQLNLSLCMLKVRILIAW